MLDVHTAPPSAQALVPYGLSHQVRLAPAFTQAPPDLTYCPHQQQTLAGGRPLAAQPELLRAYTVTWGTTANDNKTDDGG
ncbi:hypothetical protein [Actinomadura rugatobispora]|uniref:Uncharacterized protein n=1 Tax=Actinomadura rugatobispora TaxID=1994 RepID=A0ABW0ZNE9_9ACTN|nr:hypothetical protein GCM10010200_036220 [Actinomadura rugatobispora]